MKAHRQIALSTAIPLTNVAELKLRELRETPSWTIRSQARVCGKVQRLSRKGVEASASKRAAPQGDEIVWSAWQHAADSNIGSELTTPNEHKRPYSGKLEALSKFEVRKPVMQALRNDAGKTLDAAAYAQFYLTPLRVVPTGGTDTTLLTLTTNGTATLTNQVAFGSGHAKTVVDTMKERNIPAYVGDDYMAIGWPTTFRGLKNTLETLHQYTESGIKLIFNGEIGRYENMRYVEQTNVTKGITATGRAGVAWTGADSDWIFFFGEDTVAEGIAIPEEMRAKIPGDYGRSKGVAWYALLGYGIVHTNAVQARIVMWDSAA